MSSTNDRSAPDRGEGEKITNGPNARAKNESIGQTAGGIPNDTGGLGGLDLDEEKAKRMEEKLKSS